MSALSLVAGTVACVLLAAGCSSAGASRGDGGLRVVATTSIVGDLVSEIIRGDGEVEVLIPAGVDPHEFQPSAQQAARVREADLVVAVGLGLEEQVQDLLEAARAEGAEILELAPALDPLPFATAGGHQQRGADAGDEGERGANAGDEGERGADAGDGHEHGVLDPHVWLDAIRMADGVTVIGRRLAEVDDRVPDQDWQRKAAAYRQQVLRTHRLVRDILAAVPPSRRVLVSSHDNLGYLAARYGFRVAGTVTPGGTTLAEASPAELARLAVRIRELRLPAVFVDANATSDLAERLAAEAGAKTVPLFTDALAAEGDRARTYLDLLVVDATRIAEGLRGS